MSETDARSLRRGSGDSMYTRNAYATREGMYIMPCLRISERFGRFLRERLKAPSMSGQR